MVDHCNKINQWQQSRLREYVVSCCLPRHQTEAWVSSLEKELVDLIDSMVIGVGGLSLSSSGSPLKITVAVVLLIIVILFIGYGLPYYLVDSQVLSYSVSMH
jgi:hypothetical protein